MRKLFTYFIVILAESFAIHATAQVQVSTTVPITVPTVLDITFTSGQNPSANFNSTTRIDQGIALTNGTIFKYSSNQAFHIAISAASANFSSTSPTPMPASVVQFRRNSTSTYTSLSTTPASLLGTSGATISRGSSSLGIDFLINPGYAYAPATDYSLTINYTISNP
jgi:hypothetical protein